MSAPGRYTRRDLCKLADVNVDTFKTLCRRDELPLAAAEAGWRRFTANDVLKVAIACRLAGQMGPIDGLSRKTASAIAAGAPSVAEAGQSPLDVYVGFIGLQSPDAGCSGETVGPCSIVEIAASACLRRPAPNTLFLVNVSGVVRETEHRAARLGIPFLAAAPV